MLIELAEAAGVNHVIYTTSTSIYGSALEPVDRAVWVDEQLTATPRDIYDETKLAVEVLLASAAPSTTVLRIARCFPEPARIATPSPPSRRRSNAHP